jgi:hypothetical protein
MLVGTTSGTMVACTVVLAGAGFGQLEINAEGLALSVDEVAELGAGAECRLSIAEHLLMALPHVLVGPTEADNA